MVKAFRARFPAVPVECAAVEDSDFFGRTFDAVVAWGLFFLLDAGIQRRLVAKVAAVLPSGGRLPFTAPSQSCSWADAMTERTSNSLGHEAYRNAQEVEGMSLVGTQRDKGGNHLCPPRIPFRSDEVFGIHRPGASRTRGQLVTTPG